MSSLRGGTTQRGSFTAGHTARLGRPAQLRTRLRPAAATVIEHAADGSLPSTSGSARLGASSIPCNCKEDDTRLALERVYQLNGDLARQLWDDEPSIHSDSRLWDPGCFLVTVDDKPPRAKSEAKSGGNKPQPGNGRPGPGGEKSPDYYANVGDAIRTLREDIPLLFERELNYDIYREDIVFRDPRNTFAGMRNYKTIFWSLRFHGRIFFRSLYVDVQRIWQPDDSVIRMRWSVHGVPRLPWEAEGIFDGISQYRLDSQGLIYEHSVDNVILRDPPMQGFPLLTGLNLVQIPQGMQQPCPGAWITGRAATGSAEQRQGGALAAVAVPDRAQAGKSAGGSVAFASYDGEEVGSRWWRLDQGQDGPGLPAPAES